ncbi:L-rhamnose mutarotase [Streptomyces sp. NPDC059744]|uniref:L-rhamnose mutarotase n=1 Tax=Streptomyces sp. NPDC059744 TaxID=3346929 RepID=UPI00365B58F7
MTLLEPPPPAAPPPPARPPPAPPPAPPPPPPLSAAGWHNYSLFLREDGLLVGYLETEDFAAAQAAMAATDVNTRWQADMAGFFEALDGAKPDEAMKPLTEVFHLDRTQ